MGYVDTVDFKVYNSDSPKTQKSKYLENKTFFFFKWKNSSSIKGYDIMTKE